MKLYFLNLENITTKNLTDWHSCYSLIPFININSYKEIKKENKDEICYENVYSTLFLNGSLKSHERVNNPEEADYFILPFKYNESLIKKFIPLAKAHNKKIVCFYFDDNAFPFYLDENVILFRSSANKSSLHKNERILPYIAPDQKYSNLIPEESIGFCGRTQHGREKLLELIKKTNIPTNFIIREGYWNHWADNDLKLVNSRKEFNKNLTESKYQFCYRGHGNFSYRFYEVLSFGRIPILIDSDIQLPFSKIINWDEYAIIIKENEILNLPDILKSKKFSTDKNRKLWEDYFSPIGYFENFLNDI